jgi:hypothetical protein
MEESKLIKDTRYDKVLQEFKGEFDVLMRNYLQKLYNAFHEDKGIKYSHTDIVDKIKQDCQIKFFYLTPGCSTVPMTPQMTVTHYAAAATAASASF